MTNSLTIKGVKDGLLIQIPDGNWDQVQEILMATVSEQSEFLRGARLALQVDERELGAGDLGTGDTTGNPQCCTGGRGHRSTA